MLTPSEQHFFLEQGYLHVPSILTPDEVAQITVEYERVWAAERPRNTRLPAPQVLQYPAFVDLIDHPAILARVHAIFGADAILFCYDLLRHGPHSSAPERSWHRDFPFAGDNPLVVNIIIYLDEMSEQRGPTRVIPGSHRDPGSLAGADHEPIAGEVAAYAQPGDALFINAAIWHTGGRNTTDQLRRGIYLYYGYWWLRQYGCALQAPASALNQASLLRRQLLGASAAS